MKSYNWKTVNGIKNSVNGFSSKLNKVKWNFSALEYKSIEKFTLKHILNVIDSAPQIIKECKISMGYVEGLMYLPFDFQEEKK